MDLPLLVLLLLPLAAAALIVAVSSARRRRRARAHGSAEPVHRAQSDTAAVQDAAVHPSAAGPRVRSGRERRAGSGAGAQDRAG